MNKKAEKIARKLRRGGFYERYIAAEIRILSRKGENPYTRAALNELLNSVG